MARRTSDEDGEQASPFSGVGFLAAAGFLGLVVILAVVVVVTRGSGGKTATPPPTPAASSSQTAPAQAAPGCHPTDTNQTIPTAAPQGVTWSLFHRMALPSSPTAGPLVVDGDVARCYADTPAGALIAASQITIRAQVADNWQRVTEQQVVAGPGRDAYIRRYAQAGGSAAYNNLTGNGAPQWAGFKFVTYSSQLAVIEAVGRSPSNGALSTLTLTVQWSDGDWMLQPQPNGDLIPTFNSLDSLDGYVRWGGA